VDLWLTVVWVAFLAVFLGTILKRKEKHIYVANWFLLSFIVTVAMLHIVNNLSIPVSIWGSKSVQVFSGVQDAMVQWWYGHNAVGFFLTAGFLGMMYYFVPKQAERPVFSYKLSIVHFWALIFLYIWAGPHHLHYTALPDWASTLGMVFSIILWMPSWGGMINGLMTLSGAWDKLRTDPIIRMMVVSIGFYGMSTFEGPMMSIRAVNSLSHYTDWTIGHVHSGALGWNGMITFGALYFLTPRLWQRERLYSLSLVNWHFWLATIGIVLYAASMWVTGIMEGLMWREVDAQGFLVNSFADTVAAKFPMYVVRALGRHAVPRRCGDHVLQPLDDRAQVPGQSRPRAPPWLRPNKGDRRHGHPRQAQVPRNQRHRAPRRQLLVVTIGGIVEIAPALLPREHDRGRGGDAALLAARAHRARHLHPRGLLRLPQPDDPADAGRGGTLRPLLSGGGIDVRPPVPVGLEADGARPGPRGRPLLRRMACRPLHRPAIGRAGIGDAEIRLPPRPHVSPEHIEDLLRRTPSSASPIPRR
jgi:hypothetical protein